jgi:ubiquitin-protein ligase
MLGDVTDLSYLTDISDLDGGSVAQVEFPNPNDLTNFQVIVSPDSGFWSGAKYLFTIQIPALYPHEPPKVTCKTKIYHPNINLEGNVCLNILREEWKPVLDINAVIYGMIYLFYEPNPDDPLNREAADLYRNDKVQVRGFIFLFLHCLVLTCSCSGWFTVREGGQAHPAGLLTQRRGLREADLIVEQ